MKTDRLRVNQIRIDGGTQPRASINEEVVGEYASDLQRGDVFAPVIVFHDGVDFWLADGFHRYHAHCRIQCETIAAELHQGTQRDAILYSIGANATHGQRRSRDDKNKAIDTLLLNPLARLNEDGSPWSNREIARRCRVDEKTVRIRRDQMLHEQAAEFHTAEIPQYESNGRTFIHHKTGKPTRMRTAGIGRAQKQRQSNRAGLARKAFECQFHSESGPVPMRAISLPLNNPKQAARSMLSLYGEEYMRELAAELNQMFGNPKGV